MEAKNTRVSNKTPPKNPMQIFRALKIYRKDQITGFIKQMQCNALNIKITAKQVWLFFIRRTMRPGYAGTTYESLDCFEYPKNRHLNRTTQKNTCHNALPKKIPESKISKPKKSFDQPRHFKSGVVPPPHPPWG